MMTPTGALANVPAGANLAQAAEGTWVRRDKALRPEHRRQRLGREALAFEVLVDATATMVLSGAGTVRVGCRLLAPAHAVREMIAPVFARCTPPKRT
jgi:hypothetical protein